MWMSRHFPGSACISPGQINISHISFSNYLIMNNLTSDKFFSCVPYVPDPENTTLLRTSLSLYRKFHKYPEALRCAIQINDTDLVHEIFNSCKDM